MPEPLRVLLVEDRQDDAELIGIELRRAGFTVDWTRVDTDPALTAALAGDPADGPDLVVCDYSLPGMDPIDVLHRCRLARPDVPVIVASGVMDEQTCVQALRHGAVDFLLKDRLARLGPAVHAALNAAELARAARLATARERVTAGLMTALVGRAPAAICVRDRSGGTLVANDLYRDLVGRGLAERPPAGGPAWSGPELLSRSEIRLDDSTYLALRFPVPDSDGGCLAEGSILTDITAQKRTEQELRVARGELQQQAGELRASNEELRELDQLKNDFVSSVSHELRTPLTSIVGYSELLIDAGIGDPGSAHRRMVEMISGNAQRLLAMIDTLLTLSRMDGLTTSPGGEGVVPAVPTATTVTIKELVDAACAVMMPSMDAAGLTLRTMLPDPLPPVTGDRDQLERTLLNLMSNAVKFSERGGTVTVSATASDGTITLDVVDEGVGIADDELGQLFTRFYRGSAARTGAVQGTGLGLSLVKRIVERHGGSVEVSSRLGHGTTATVRLPAARAAVQT
jgi:signal transduction histidine kinase